MRGWEIDLEAARPIAAEGLRLCLAGDDTEGLARYRSVAFPQHFAHLPLGLHIHMLREAGREAAADALTAIALGGGGDLAWKATRAGVSDADRAAEYARFFAAGLGNPHMVDRYLRALTRSGRSEEVAAIFDPVRLLHTVRIPGDVAQALRDREAEGRESDRQSVYKMRMVRGLGRMPEFDAVLAACRAETAAYFARWAASDHPLAGLVPSNFEIRAWGLISRGEGYNSRHQHPVGWATGVYYPIGLPDAISGGSLCVGGWRDPAPAGWPSAKLRPEAGLLVLMPSYYVHWTEPLGAPGLRLSVAFDAVPA